MVSPTGLVFQPAPPLQSGHLAGCELYPDRLAMLSTLPHGGVVAEVGVQTGAFSASILSLTRPAHLMLIDLDLGQILPLFDEVLRSTPTVRIDRWEGDSAQILGALADGCLDWVYIDADHSYEAVRADALVAMTKVRPGGYLVFNDYTMYSPLEHLAYGVIHVVHELCLDHGYHIVKLALHPFGYYDVALARRDEAAGTAK